MNNGTNSLLTLVFASLFLVSISMISHNAFAMGAAPSTCSNLYDGTITSFIINNGTQTFDVMANPGLTFDENSAKYYNVTFVIHTLSTSSQNNTNPGTTWYSTNWPGFYWGVCVDGAGPNQNVTVGTSWGIAGTTAPGTTQNVQVGTLLNSNNPVTFNVHWIANSATVPSAPQNLQAIEGNSQVSLSWSAPASDGNSSLTGYNIYRGTTPSGENTNPVASTTYTTYTDTRLSNGLTYYYTVRAVNYVGVSPASNEAGATPSANTTIPSAPENLSANAVSPSKINLSWTAPSNTGGSAITGYRIERLQGNSSIWSTTVSNTASTATTYSDTGLAASTSYTYRVSAINSVGTSFPSNTASATTPATPSQNASAGTIIAKITTWDNTSGNPGNPQPNLSAVNTKTGMVYVVEDDTVAYQYAPHDHFIAVIDGTTNTLVAEIQTQAIARGMAVNPDTDLIYATINGTVSIINGTTNSISATIPVPGATGIGVNPATDLVYASGSGNKITVIDGKTDAIVATIAVGTNPGSIGVNPVTDRIYVQNQGVCEPTPPAGCTLEYYSVSVIDGSTNTVTDTLPLAVGLIAVNQNTDKIYAQSGNRLYVINGTTDSYTTVPVAVSCLGVNPGTNKIYACPGASFGPTLEIISGSTDTVMCYLTGFNAADAAVANPDTDRIYVSDYWGFAVYAVDGSGNNCAPPSAPQNLAATAGNSQVSLAWMAPAFNGGPAITGYNVYRGALSGNEAFLVKIGNVTSYNDTALTNGQEYFYKVTAINSAGESPQSSEASATPSAPVIPPSAPTNLSTTTVSSSQVNLLWTAPTSNGGPAVTGYMVKRSADNGTTWSTIANNASSASTTYNDTGLSPNTAYAYEVAAINSVGASLPSNIAYATTPATVPSASTGLAATAVSPKNIDLSWNAPTSNGGSPVTGYKIMISTDGSSFATLVNDANNAGTTYSASGLHPHTTYYFEVSAINSVGTSAPSNVASIATR